MRALVLLFLLSLPAAAADCPDPPDTVEARAALLQQVRVAKDEATANGLMNRLWLLWTRAPDDRAQALLDRGMERREVSDYAEAEIAFSDLIAYCPAYAEGWNQRAFIRFLQGRYPESVADLRHALDLSPDHIAARTGLALSLLGAGRTEAGQTALREALAMNPWLMERTLLVATPKPGEKL